MSHAPHPSCVLPALPRQFVPPPAAAVPASVAPSRRSTQPTRGTVRSLADLGRDKDDSDDDEQNEYYAGGEKSGQVRP